MIDLTKVFADEYAHRLICPRDVIDQCFRCMIGIYRGNGNMAEFGLNSGDLGINIAGNPLAIDMRHQFCPICPFFLFFVF